MMLHVVGDCRTHLGRQSRGEVNATRTQWAGVEVEKGLGGVFLCSEIVAKESCVRHVWLVRRYDPKPICLSKPVVKLTWF